MEVGNLANVGEKWLGGVAEPPPHLSRPSLRDVRLWSGGLPGAMGAVKPWQHCSISPLGGSAAGLTWTLPIPVPVPWGEGSLAPGAEG